jgi:hypothetical protein
VPEAFAGFICGYAMALALTPTLAYTLLKLRAGNGVLARLLPVGTSATGFAAILHMGLFFACTGLGMIFGLVLLAMDGAGGALGSPNGPYTLFVFGSVLAIVAPLFVLLPPLRPMMAANALLAVAGFGWLMPYMAQWAP